MKEAYIFDIARTDDVQLLLALAEDIRKDESFHSVEKDELLEMIRLRICAINAKAMPAAKPRW